MNKIKTLVIAIIILGITLPLTAQNEDHKWSIGLNGGAIQYSGDLGNGFFKFDQALYASVGGSFSRYLTPHLDLVANFDYGEVGHVENATNHFRHEMFRGNLSLKVNFLRYKSNQLRPYAFVGVGFAKLNDLSEARKGVSYDNWVLPDVGLGLAYNINESWSIILQETFMYTDYDRIDYEKGSEKINDSFLQHSLGIAYHFGGKKDSDGDGVPDKEDLCPEVKGLVELMGCPDADGDGIADKDDACPNAKGLEAFNGCPDTDGDGIADKDDECPNEKGLKAFNGCPDTDGDGIPDKDDKCPNEKGLKAFNGCPDTDGDGIQDKDDACPNEKGLKAFNGCPDTDGDGIPDKDDKCPNVKGVKSNKGCPEIKKEEKEVLQKAMYGIKFQSGKDIITSNSNAILDKVVEVMKSSQAYKLTIDGHTDSSGKDEMNMDLSIRRAAAVKKYLVDHGISESRLTSRGFGETKPVADNKTAAGRAKNRRVELSIDF